MGRYTGPKTKVSRRYGVPLFGPSKALERKNYPPGIHGPRGSRRKQSDYAVALGEKQKLRYQYGLLEPQFRRIFQSALRKRGVTGETLLQLLETRIDNVVYRLGLANTRSAARQLVSHGHVMVNGRTVNVSSYNVKAGDEIAIKDRPKSRQLALRNLELTQTIPAPYRSCGALDNVLDADPLSEAVRSVRLQFVRRQLAAAPCVWARRDDCFHRQ